MEGLSKYWRLARLRSDGSQRILELPGVSTYLQSTFPDSLENEGVDKERRLCIDLFDAWRSGEALAGLSLRCRISHAIVQECHALIQQYGESCGLDRRELLPICLADEGKPVVIDEFLAIAQDKSRFRPLSYEILATYDPAKSGISTWTGRLLSQHGDVKRYLRDHGILMISDWALLNDTKTQQVQRMLIEQFSASEGLANRSALIHEAYRSVYLIGASQGVRCADPTEAQLQQMSDYLYAKTPKIIRNDDILDELRAIAKQIRAHRLKQLPIPKAAGENSKDEDENSKQEFLMGYQQEFKGCLNAAIVAVIQYRITAYVHPSGQRRPKPEAAAQMLKALHLYYCEGRSQSEIATLIELQRQDQVSRLLKLPDLRSDIRLHMLPCLKNYIGTVVEASFSPERLIGIAAALEGELDRLVQADETAGATNKKFTATASQLGQHICRYLDSLPPKTLS
jgi:hypothetical protein